MIGSSNFHEACVNALSLKSTYSSFSETMLKNTVGLNRVCAFSLKKVKFCGATKYILENVQNTNVNEKL